ncbi:MAG: sigma-70 family RNA polymerase sigma factor [Planctomycetes bacterium]|nr:sigma-70 family RNA polymerase sigma factor [Planctomycetota bacterium]
MTPTTEQLCRLAQDYAQRFLRRFEDPLTRASEDDIVQDSAIAAWQWVSSVREPRRFEAAVRTIARRKRCRALREHHRRRSEEWVAGRSGSDGVGSFDVEGRQVPRDWLLPRLARSLGRLRSLDRCLLMALQEGFSGSEVADRYGLSEDNVKVRAHRARQRVRLEIEEAVRVARCLGGFDG